MYAKDYNMQNTSQKIPVETFDAGPGLSEFARRNCAETAKVTDVPKSVDVNTHVNVQDCANHTANTSECTSQNSLCTKQGGLFSKLGTDDLLLIALIVILLVDNDQSNDYIIPLLLAALVLF